MKQVEGYKLTRPDGYDFYTGKTIMYRGNYPHVVRVPTPRAALGVCSPGVIHGSIDPNDCFVGAKIPCSAFRFRGIPVCGDKRKYGFLEMTILEEITDLDGLFGWRYSEAVNPIHPFRIREQKVTTEDIANLRRWATLASVRNNVRNNVWDNTASVGASVWGSMASVWDSMPNAWDCVWAYIGSLFPNITKWKYIDHKEGEYPFQPAVDLWRRGFVPSFDGRTWRLHSGQDAKVVYEYATH